MTDGWDNFDDFDKGFSDDDEEEDEKQNDAETSKDGKGADGKEENEEDVWVNWTLADIEADMEQAVQELPPSYLQTSSKTEGVAEQNLREAFKQNLTKGKTFEADIFFQAPRALHELAVELQELMVKMKLVHFDRATLLASLAYGPLRSPAQASANTATSLDGISIGLDWPEKAPELEVSWPSSSSSSLDAYTRLLHSLPHHLHLARDVRLSMRDVDKYQDKKDISRDELIVNGTFYSGAQGGYDAAIEAIAVAVQRSEEDEGARKLRNWSQERLERAAQLLLSVLNRTSSGFAAFEQVLQIFDCQDVVIISPDSAAAKPLEVAIIGGVALGRAHTRYIVRRSDGGGDPLATVDTSFTFELSTVQLWKVAGEGNDAAWITENFVAPILLQWA
mmetsp:Transcript_62762/g.132553  ORF Transcript_62762/g.132553 Transcript_62762/m.132553 type:complete len:392 (-) Transcript_62762:243-1418(-)